MLLSVTYKVRSRVVLNRLTTTVDPLLRKKQAGFRKGRGCADQIFTLRQIVEQSNEWSSTVYANFIDFIKAFDSVNRPTLARILGPVIIRSQTSLCPSSKCSTQRLQCKSYLWKRYDRGFCHTAGVKQGCVLSLPFSFLFVQSGL